MQVRELGQSRLALSALGLGCMGLSGLYGARDEAESLRVLARALELGVNFFDTADIYARGQNEELVRRAFAGRFNEIVIATKCGYVRNGEIDASPAHIRAACESSLQRLGIGTIDLYYLHRASAEVPIEDSVGALADLVRAGKVRHIGLSEVSAQTLRRAMREHPIAAVQSEYSIFTRNVERSVLPACRALGVGFVPFSPLGRGLLTGAIQTAADLGAGDVRAYSPRFGAEHLTANMPLIETVQAIATAHGCTPSQIALAWVLAQGPDIIPIPGTARIANLEANLRSTDIVLAQEDLAALDSLATRVSGERESAALSPLLEADTPPRP